MTIEQVKEDISSGKSDCIYYSANTLWWTHLVDDVTAATAMGKKATMERNDRMMQDPSIPQSEKERIQRLFEKVNSATGVPLDITGSPLYMMQDVSRWVTVAEGKPQHFGKHGIEAFIKAHHQNCEGKAGDNWAFYNEMLDNNK